MTTHLRPDYFGYRVTCKVCGHTKQPVGRSAPLGLMCDSDCEGYLDDPLPSHLWPGESKADFGFKVPR
jgi:hypothetical protein